MQFVKAEQSDLDHILAWLHAEEQVHRSSNGDNGFWCNRTMITRAFDNEGLEVVRIDGAAIAFHFGQFVTPGITEVHPDFRGRGIGTMIVERILERGYVNELCKLHVQCISESSRRFWAKFGFLPEAEGSENYCLVLRHSLPLPRPPETNVTVNFFDEEGWYTQEAPYKSARIPCVFEPSQILLSELCHDAVVGIRVRGGRHIRVLQDNQILFEGWSTSKEAAAFFHPRQAIPVGRLCYSSARIAITD